MPAIRHRAAPTTTHDRHAATAVWWLSTGAIFRQPSILRNLICPLATRPKSRINVASSDGSEPCVFVTGRCTRRDEYVQPEHTMAEITQAKNVLEEAGPVPRTLRVPGQRASHPLSDMGRTRGLHIGRRRPTLRPGRSSPSHPHLQRSLRRPTQTARSGSCRKDRPMQQEPVQACLRADRLAPCGRAGAVTSPVSPRRLRF